MSYITVKLSPQVRQMTIDELLFSSNFKPIVTNQTGTSTKTFWFDEIPDKYKFANNITRMIKSFKDFNEKYENLRKVDRYSLYHTFYIPKKSGGLRRIDAPNDDLKRALSELKDILEDTCGALYHTSAFAYIKGRSVIKALQRHQKNESKWYGKLDLSNFFGSTTIQFAMSMLSIIYPFSEIISWPEGNEELEKAIELGFLDCGLPQGTPLSPTLTNIIMIPIDFEFGKVLRSREQNFVCTRYADDFTISSKQDYNVKEIEDLLRSVLCQFDSPYVIKKEKTRYGSVAGQNWNLGLMINANNEITIGYKRKREFKAMLTNYVLDTKNGKAWNLEDVQVMEGLRNYYTSVEPDNINEIIKHLNEKFGVDIRKMIKNQLSGCSK